MTTILYLNSCGSSRGTILPLDQRPLFTREFENPDDFEPETGSVYLYGVTSEPRSEFAVNLMRRRQDIAFVEIRERDGFSFETDRSEFEHVPIRRRSRLEAFVNGLSGSPIYLDITGLTHATWAPLVRVCSLRLLILQMTSSALLPFWASKACA